MTNPLQHPVVKNDAPERIGVALSGGGFRATLYHLGVVRFLYEAGLLSRVQFVGGVSGGSILAIHVGLHWDRYTGDEARFNTAAREILDFCRRDVRNRIVRRWLFGILTLIPRLLLGKSRVQLLISEYEALFGKHTLNDLLPTPEVRRPRIMAQAVSLTTGEPCSFGRSGFMWYKPNARAFRKEKEVPKLAPHLPIALAVAASSAFPPLFPPVLITSDVLHVDKSKFDKDQYITDGGVYENLGIERPLWHYEQHKELDAFIVSDAGATFDWATGAYRFALSRNLRATDILMKRVGDLVYRGLKHRHKFHKFAYVKIADQSKTTPAEFPRMLPPAVQRRVSGIRTDLDAFTDLEISSLLQHGYEVARKVLIKKGWIDGGMPHYTWYPVQVKTPDAATWADSLCNSAVRRYLPLFAVRDWPVWLAMAIFIVAPALAILVYFLWGREPASMPRGMWN